MADTSNRPAASVLLPVYNAGNYLGKAIESVLTQSFTDFELLLLNDGSSDGSLEILERYSAKDTRCRVHSWPNRGLIATLNEGIRLAKAEIIFRMDADDICHPARFEKQMAYLDQHPECVALGSRVMLIDPDGQPIMTFVDATTHDTIDQAHFTGRGGAIPHPSAAMRKSVLTKLGGYREAFPHAEDIDLFLRLAEVGQLANLPEVLLDYRQHLSSIGYKHRDVQMTSTRRAVAEAARRRSIPESNVVNSFELTTKAPCLADIQRKWSWWALSGKNVATARKYAWKAFKSSPFEIENFKLLACVLRGH